jgi:hypothetical protein
MASKLEKTPQHEPAERRQELVVRIAADDLTEAREDPRVRRLWAEADLLVAELDDDGRNVV